MLNIGWIYYAEYLLGGGGDGVMDLLEVMWLKVMVMGLFFRKEDAC